MGSWTRDNAGSIVTMLSGPRPALCLALWRYEDTDSGTVQNDSPMSSQGGGERHRDRETHPLRRLSSLNSIPGGIKRDLVRSFLPPWPVSSQVSQHSSNANSRTSDKALTADNHRFMPPRPYPGPKTCRGRPCKPCELIFGLFIVVLAKFQGTLILQINKLAGIFF